MIATIHWSGTLQESRDLANAIGNNCACSFTESGVRRALCAPHHMLVRDQRALDGLLFVRSIRDHLIQQEHTV